MHEFPLGEIVAVLEHDGREKHQKDDIPYLFLIVRRLSLKKISGDKDDDSNNEADEDGNGGFLEVVELFKLWVTLRWVKYVAMMT